MAANDSTNIKSDSLKKIHARIPSINPYVPPCIAARAAASSTSPDSVSTYSVEEGKFSDFECSSSSFSAKSSVSEEALIAEVDSIFNFFLSLIANNLASQKKVMRRTPNPAASITKPRTDNMLRSLIKDSGY